MPSPDIHARGHRANSTDPIPVLLHVRVFTDFKSITAGDGARTFSITEDLGGTYLRSAHAGNVTVGAGAAEIQLHNLRAAVDMLADPIVIDAGDDDSYSSATPSLPDKTGTPPNNRVLRGDKIRVDIDQASGVGLELFLEFGPQLQQFS